MKHGRATSCCWPVKATRIIRFCATGRLSSTTGKRRGRFCGVKVIQRNRQKSRRNSAQKLHFRESALESEDQPIGDAMRWTVVQVAEALGVPAPASLDPMARVAGVSIDSRTVQPGELYIAIRGP